MPGKCRAKLPVYYWNGSACVKGIYGGCGLNKDTIFTEQLECERVANSVCATEEAWM